MASTSTDAKPFLLAQPGPRACRLLQFAGTRMMQMRRCYARVRSESFRVTYVAVGKDELRGDSDLFEAHNLTRIARAVLSGNMRHGDYLKGIAGGSDLRKCVTRGWETRCVAPADVGVG